ncbi:MAG: DUF2911 domain-containing protein [Chitinophagaceae bacterium]
MKLFMAFCFLFFFCACEDQNPKPVQKTIVARKDSGIINKDSGNPYAPVDISPMDISYFPQDYPVLRMSKKINSQPIARVIYSRPHKQGRKIFGSLLKYGEAWRLGANEATEIEFFQTVSIQNKKINKGRYILYSIPQQDNWTVIFNSNTFSWGLRPDPLKDLHKFTIPVSRIQIPLEFFTIVFEKTDRGADLLIAWDDVVARMPIILQ